MTAKTKLWKNMIICLTTKNAFFIVTFLVIVGTSSAFSQANNNGKKLSHFLEKNGYIAIKLEKYRTGHLYTEVTINGVIGRFIVDSGAGATILEEKRKDKFNIVATPSELKGTGAGASGIATQSSTNNKLIISGYASDNFTITLMNLDHINTAFKKLGMEEVDGVLGADILLLGQAIIDYPNMILYLKK